MSEMWSRRHIFSLVKWWVCVNRTAPQLPGAAPLLSVSSAVGLCLPLWVGASWLREAARWSWARALPAPKLTFQEHTPPRYGQVPSLPLEEMGVSYGHWGVGALQTEAGFGLCLRISGRASSPSRQRSEGRNPKWVWCQVTKSLWKVLYLFFSFKNYFYFIIIFNIFIGV